MPKRPGAQGHVGLGERVGQVVQLTGKLSRWRVRLVLTHKKIPHRHAYSHMALATHVLQPTPSHKMRHWLLYAHCSPHLRHPLPTTHGR